MGNESDSSNVWNRARGLAAKPLLLIGGALLAKRLSKSTTRWDHARFATSSLTGEKEAAMSAPIPPALLFLLVLLLIRPPTSAALKAKSDDPVPADWPHQFHSLLFMNMSDGTLQKIDLWYDWPNGRNFNIIQNQLSDEVKYDLEWNNGTSFIYTLDPSKRDCQVLHVDVGILRPNWLDGANYLGQDMVDNFLCNVWEKVEFIWYYEDVLTKRPVKWIFYSGYTAHVMTFEVGAVLDDPNWQAPVYCFSDNEKERKSSRLELGGSFGRLMRGMANAAHDM